MTQFITQALSYIRMTVIFFFAVHEDSSYSVSKNIPHFMETKSSLSCSQQPATGPYPEPHEYIQHPQTLFL
jgi:hypothetical protein